MGVVRRILCSILTVLSLLGSCLVPGTVYNKIEDRFADSAKASYSGMYYTVREKKNNTDTWRQGMVSGNGLQGVVTSGAPYNDTLIYQHMHFIMPNEKVRFCPDTADELETVKQNITNGEDIVDNASYDDVYSYHPGAALRIKQPGLLPFSYARYTDYETAQVGVYYKDIKGTWERTTFTSQADDVTITKLSASSGGKKVNATLSIDNISAFANYGGGSEKDIQYKKTVGENGTYIAFIAHYPDYENSELKDGGYATLVYVLTEGGSKEVTEGKTVTDAQYVGKNNPQIEIKDADAVYLLAVSDRTYDMGPLADFAGAEEYELLASLKNKAEAVAGKYTVDGTFGYDAARKAHTDIFTPQYNAVTFILDGADSTKPNEQLVLSQHGKKTVLNTLAQRAYYSGRYAYLCCAGYSTSRLYGMWTGEWSPGWGSKYTMDANVNLQTSSMNTSNMKNTYIGYAGFILRQAPDWEENATATHGFTDAIQAPVNTDGDKAVITETCYPYPFRYWNAGASWMLQPLFETLQYYGDVQIPLNGEFDLQALKSVLSVTQEDLTDEQIKKLEDKGYLDLRTEILLPLLTKAANYWDQMLTPAYYTDAKGKLHYDADKTELAENEYFTILPGYSPENNPSDYPSPSAANTAIDIAACKDNLHMLIDILKSTDANADTSHWEYLISGLPVYLYDETGALKEWATTDFEENNLHRHLSHLYCVWPLFETQDDSSLKNAALQAIANRESENQASHALVHRALIAARLKDSESLTQALADLMNHGIYYDSLLTNHDYDRNSAFCTDFAIGYLGIVHESLLFSRMGEIEILPALPESGFSKGCIKGLRAATRATADDISWDLANGTASVTITSDIAQTITVSCGLSDQVHCVTLAENETVTIEFTLLTS